MSFVPPGKNQSYVPPKQQTLSGRTEQGRAGQGSSLACICSTETFLRVNGWQRVGQKTDIIHSDFIKPKTTCYWNFWLVTYSSVNWAGHQRTLYDKLSTLSLLSHTSSVLICPAHCPPSLTSNPLCDPLLSFLCVSNVFKCFVIWASWKTAEVWNLENLNTFTANWSRGDSCPISVFPYLLDLEFGVKIIMAHRQIRFHRFAL